MYKKAKGKEHGDEGKWNKEMELPCNDYLEWFVDTFRSPTPCAALAGNLGFMGPA